MTWPSARRTMYGGSLKPESWYSPTSSTPSASRGGGSAACGAGVVWASGVPAGGVLVVMESASARVGSPVGSERPHVREEALDQLRSRLVGLRDRGRLRGLSERDRVVGQDVRGDGGVDRRGHVRVDQRHRGALGQLLPGELVELLAGQRAVLLRGVLSHARLLLVGLGVLRAAVGLRDRRVLRRLGDGDRAVGERVQRDGRVHRRRNVGVDQRHRGALGQLLARELLELLARERPVLVRLVRHRSSSGDWSVFSAGGSRPSSVARADAPWATEVLWTDSTAELPLFTATTALTSIARSPPSDRVRMFRRMTLRMPRRFPGCRTGT